MRERVPGWPGYLHEQADGRKLFIIEKQVTFTDEHGERRTKRFHVSTGAHDFTSAREQLTRFEANPIAYSRVGDVRSARPKVTLTTERLELFHNWQVERGLTGKYAREVNTWLVKWLRHLRGVDLRRLDLARDVMPLLDASAPGARRSLMASLKTYCSWLRTERHELTSGEDATRDLKLPQSDPAKHTRRVAHDLKHVRKVAALLKGVYRDALLFQVATGCHVSELERFVRDSRSNLRLFKKPQRLADGSKARAVVSVWHKASRMHKIALVRVEHVEAARRLHLRGSLPSRSDLNKAIRDACLAAGVPPMSFVFRHSVLTWGAKRNVTEERLMKHAGHQDARTTRRYIDVDLPLAAIPAEKI